MYKSTFKRLIDLIAALLAFLILLPIILIVAFISLIVNKSNPFFSQERPGKNEVVFKMYKFKSMTDKKDENGKLLPDEVRLTKLGNILRKTSLDELPQLINVISGNMSLVGPRLRKKCCGLGRKIGTGCAICTKFIISKRSNFDLQNNFKGN